MDTTYQSLKTETLAANLIKARESCGKTIKDASSLIGIPTSRLKNYEQGKYTPSLPELESLSYIYRIPLFALLTEDIIDDFIHSPDPDQMQKLIEIRQRIIGTRIQLGREEAGVSYKKLSQETGISAARIKRFEKGMVPTPLDELIKLGDALGLDFSELVDSDSPLGKWQTKQSSISAFNMLPDELAKFIVTSENEKYLTVAKNIADIGIESLTNLSSSLNEISDNFSLNKSVNED